MRNGQDLAHYISKENFKLNYQNKYCFLKTARQVNSKAISTTNLQLSTDQQQSFNKDNDTKLIIQQNKDIINKLSQPKLNKLRNALLIGQKARIIKILLKENTISNKKKSQLFGGSKNLKNLNSDQKTIFKKNRKKISSLKSTNVEENKIKVEFDETQNEKNYSNTQQGKYDKLNKELEEFFLNWPKYIEIIDQTQKMKKQKILDGQKGKQHQSTTIISQSSQTAFQLSDQGICISNKNTSSQFGQKGVERYQTLKEMINAKQQNEESKKKQPLKKKILDNDSEQFLRQIFKLNDHIDSGLEADIFANQNDDNIVYRVIKLDRDQNLTKQGREILRFQELEEQNILNITSSHLIVDKINKTDYIIQIIQKCQMSLKDEISSKKVYSLKETLKFISTAFHLLIVLRQKYIYHSDIKPGNILKTDDNNYKLSDFGASQQVDFINPFCDYEMYTEGYTPKNRDKNLPFYHDIYSIGKTIQKLLMQLENHSEIYDCLNKFIDEKICKDDENSIYIDCFKLPRKFINILMKFTNDEVIEVFLEEYLKQIEQYLVIKKENKVFQYESQYQYADIALLIVSQKSQDSNKQNQLNPIKIKALITKSYILCKRKQYEESLQYINEIFRKDFEDDSQSEILIKSIRIVTKILIKLNNKTKLSQENQNKLIELIKLVNISEEFDKLKIKIIELLLLKSNDIYPIIRDFYDSLEKQNKNQDFHMLDRVIIKLIRYLRKQNCYDQSLYEVIQFIEDDNTNDGSYYKQKLLKEMGLCLYKFLFQKNEQLDIKFFVKYEKEILILPLLILNCLNIYKPKSNLQIYFDKSIWQLYSIFIKLQELNIYSFVQCKRVLNSLEQKYKNIMVKIKKDNQLPYKEYKINYYEKYLKKKEEKKYQFFNEEEISNKEKKIIESISLIQQTIGKDNKEILKEIQSESLLNSINYFESERISLTYLGSLEKFNEELESLNSQLNFYNIIHYNPKNLHEKDIIFEEITSLNVELQDRCDESKFQFEKEGSLTLRIQTREYFSQEDISVITFFTSNLRKVQALKLKFKYIELGDNIFPNLQSYQMSDFQFLEEAKILNNITQLTLDFRKSLCLYESFQIFFMFARDCEELTSLNFELKFKDNEVTEYIQDTLKQIYDRLKISFPFTCTQTDLKKIIDIRINLNDQINTEGFRLNIHDIIDDIKCQMDSPGYIGREYLFQHQFKLTQKVDKTERKLSDQISDIPEEYLDQSDQSENTTQQNNILSLHQYSGFLDFFFGSRFTKITTLSEIQINWQNIFTTIAQNIAQYLQTKQKSQFDLNLFVQGSQLFNEDQCFKNCEQINKYVQFNCLSMIKNKESIKEIEQKLNIEMEQLNLYLDFNTICSEAATVIKNMLYKFKSNIKLKHMKNFDFGTVMSSLDKPVNTFKIDLCYTLEYIYSKEAQMIANALAKCQNTTKLNLCLSKSCIREKIIQIIANSLEKFEEITELSLNLSENHIGSQGAEYISNAIKHFRKAIQLDIDLSKNGIKDKGAQSIAEALQYCQNITTFNLSLRNNNIGVESIKNIVNSLEMFKKLSQLHLDLSENDIKDEGANILVRSLKKFENMAYLKLVLNKNGISSEGAMNISNALKRCNKIARLNIDFTYQQIDGKGFNSIINILFKCQKITHLSLYFDKVQNDMNVSLNIENNDEQSHNITQFSLNLSGNQISLEQTKNITRRLKRRKNLQKLNLYLKGNHLENGQIQIIANFLQNCQSLTEITLNLMNNKIFDEGAKAIANSLTKCRNLTLLNLNIYGNKITSEGISSITNALEKCQIISKLNLILDEIAQGYAISNIFAGNLANSENFSELNLQFHMHFNYISKNICKLLKNCQNLTQLSLRFNWCYHTTQDLIHLPKNFQNLYDQIEKLQYLTRLELGISEHQIKDEGAYCISRALVKCQNITQLILILEANQITYKGAQEIASAIEKCQKISNLTLNLNSNQIQDEGAQSISNTMEKCLNITELDLDLSYNQISAKGKDNLKIALERSQHIIKLFYSFENDDEFDVSFE
ncbi:kinase domain protein (macronuclear) [Tetrahymena thermophila SB210]|uniref:Kinase domain protein n=1 Tax=Tetrahymena thermophila (strain SB210) TaxID=312017 RepID=Q24D30_TETTS|nr:kinase domain protein [Tetrahymena thermophila SB210]EAS05682.3 kinase domain protein [Tetrahymena thermophila SB210]|eukprot:XP_001025927.3 kinase domain protein [Tetrahymena thermophila SB210]